MGPLLYSLIRFVKPRRVLEVGAGYTSLWILQALADNESELQMCEASVCADGYNVAGAEWMVGDGESGDGAVAEAEAAEAAAAGTGATAASGAWATALATMPPMLHAIDDMGAAEGGNRGTVHLVVETAQRLKLVVSSRCVLVHGWRTWRRRRDRACVCQQN